MKTQEHVRECDTVGSETFPSLVCMAWLCSLPGIYPIQPRGGQWISLNDTKARELRLGMKPLASHNLLLLGIKSSKGGEKQLWSALFFSPLSLFLGLFSVLTPFSCTLHHKARLSFHQLLVEPFLWNMILPHKLSLYEWCESLSTHKFRAANRHFSHTLLEECVDV